MSLEPRHAGTCSTRSNFVPELISEKHVREVHPSALTQSMVAPRYAH